MYKTYKEIRKELKAEYKKQIAENAEFIKNGFLSRWGGVYEISDDGIKHYSTATRWEQYKAGTITRAQAVEFATKREHKKIEERYKKQLAFIEEVEAAEIPETIEIAVNWKRSSVWGMNPTAEIWTSDGRGITTGHASGCGYDKESAAIASAAHYRPGVVKVLCELKEKALRKNRTADKSKTACTGIDNRDAVGYGAGYGVIPQLEGGVGVSCFVSIFEAAGFKTSQHHGKTYDCYTFTK